MGKTARKANPTTPFAVGKAPRRDERIPARLWALPRRIERANLNGPRFNQLELARKSKLSKSVISRLLSWSNLYAIQLQTIYRLARALQVSVAWLLGEDAGAEPARGAEAPRRPKEPRAERPTHRRLRVSKGPSRRTG